MKRNLSTLVLASLLLAVVLQGVAQAAPAITQYGKVDRIVRNVRSMQTTRLFVKTDTAGAWAVMEVLSARGVVRVLYSGPAAAPGVLKWTLPWSGTDYLGRKLADGNYKYRIRVSRGGQTAYASGVMPIHDSEVDVAALKSRMITYALSGTVPGYSFTVVTLRLGQDHVGAWWALGVLKPNPPMDWPTAIMTKAVGSSSWTGVDFGTGLTRDEVPAEVRADLF